MTSEGMASLYLHTCKQDTYIDYMRTYLRTLRINSCVSVVCTNERYPLNSARTFRQPSFQRTQLGAANHSAYSTRRHQMQRLHISVTFISANTTSCDIRQNF